MKILKATTVYERYLKAFRRAHNELPNKSYLEQSNFFLEDAFGWSNFWQKALATYGWEVFEVVANFKTLQLTWAKENHLVVGKNNWIAEILIAQIQDYKPDIIFLDDHTLLSCKELIHIRKTCPSVRLVISWCGAPFNQSNVFSQHDLVLSCIPEIVKQLKQLGCQSQHLHHAFFPNVLKRINSTQGSPIPLSFIGQIARGNNQHVERGRLLETLASKNLPLEIYTPSHEWSVEEKIKSWTKQRIGSTYPALSLLKGKNEKKIQSPFIHKIKTWKEQVRPYSYRKLSHCMRRPVFGLRMFETLARSEITINCHIDISKDSASNMRLFEATGMGSCLLTDYKSNLSQLFELDYEVVTYRSQEECVDKATWLIQNPDKRMEIAKAGQRKTLREHTFEKRSAQLINIIQSHI